MCVVLFPDPGLLGAGGQAAACHRGSVPDAGWASPWLSAELQRFLMLFGRCSSGWVSESQP